MAALLGVRCKHIVYDNLRGTECRLTGGSASDDCGNPAYLVLDDGGECIPLQALRYLRGDRVAFALLSWRDRELVMMTAETIRERIEAGLVPRDDREETGQVASEAVGDLSSMTAEQLRELARRAGQQAKLREQAEKRKGVIVPVLRAAVLEAEARHTELRAALAEAEEGRPVDLKALGVKMGRLGKEVAAPRPSPASARLGLTPAERFARAERVLERHAKQGGWSRKKLADALKRAREKAGL